MKTRPASTILCSIRKLKKSRFIAILMSLCALVFLIVFARSPLSSAQTSESISIFAADCATPKTIFHKGDTVCAVSAGALLGPPTQRRFEWVAPDGSVFQLGPDIISDPQNNSITIPTSGVAAQVGNWTVKTVDASNNGVAVARFVVQDPNNPATDLWTPIFAPFQVSPGSSAPFTVFVTNKGPSDAHDVELTVTVATNSTFVSETQSSGPAFSCSNPLAGATSSSTCTIANLPANQTAVLQFIFQVDPGAPEGALVSSTATVSSSTSELFADDNTFTASVAISQATCDVSCPAGITMAKDAGQCGAIVTYATPAGAGSNCGTVICSPASGSFFPIGTTNVSCFGDTGGPCSFAVTIQDSQPFAINCPANVTVNESSPGLGFAAVNYPAPTLNDNCPAPVSACSPPSGSSFPVGTTTVTCETGDGSGSTITCSFTVTVNSMVCVLHCSENIVVTESPSGSGSATVTYSAPTPSNCPTLTIACSPPSGSVFPLGSTVVTCTGIDSSSNEVSCSFTITVNSATPCSITCPPNITASNESNQCGAVVSFPAPTTSGNCGGDVPTCAPPSGAFFPVGATLVTCATEGGPQCSFIITVADTQAPAVSSSVSTASLWPPNHNLINVGLAITNSDNCDASVSVEVAVFGDEDDLGAGSDGNFSPDAKDIAPGALRLRSERSGNADGRVYLIVVKATDAAGNTGFSCSTVVVPKSQSQADINSVEAQAAAARAFCLAHNGAAPSNYFVVGDGPIVGPKQ